MIRSKFLLIFPSSSQTAGSFVWQSQGMKERTERSGRRRRTVEAPGGSKVVEFFWGKICFFNPFLCSSLILERLILMTLATSGGSMKL